METMAAGAAAGAAATAAAAAAETAAAVAVAATAAAVAVAATATAAAVAAATAAAEIQSHLTLAPTALDPYHRQIYPQQVCLYRYTFTIVRYTFSIVSIPSASSDIPSARKALYIDPNDSASAMLIVQSLLKALRLLKYPSVGLRVWHHFPTRDTVPAKVLLECCLG